ncbi:ubiquinol-cytochrome c reductase cytochrome c1 subunit [Phaffia rhodozyma]|uniref:quinol--cytochrome-c reductase n=1 Tax=Phaffia rhodozyma TaxID=264483 RepID=A0A0F7SM11_PHARH|nr:ubiquinol-cytochrome c reductase cytochrome c1 subunit [Phaffia rhodozyma]
MSFARLATQSFKATPAVRSGARFASSTPSAKWVPSRLHAAGATLATVGTVSLYGYQYGLPGLDGLLAEASANTVGEDGFHPANLPFYHKGFLNTFEHDSIRRGYQVYKEVCSACHSLKRIAWRNLVGVSHTVDEVKAFAADAEYEDGPNDEGEMFMRPGKLADYMPSPYPNDQASRASNAGALPPDLSLITKARHGNVDYVFSLLTGYVDAPAGIEIREGMHYNPYFPGGGIGMGRVLYDGLIEYEDGTPATTSQMAKDVTTFLSWAAEPELDERHKLGLQASVILSAMWALSIWIKRYKWAPIKSRKILYNPPRSSH